MKAKKTEDFDILKKKINENINKPATIHSEKK